MRNIQMARAKAQKNGRLEEATANMFQALAAMLLNQTAMSQQQTATLARMAETDREIAGFRQRFDRIEAMLLEHNRILTEHSQILRGLTDAIREKIGFKTPEP